MLFFLGMSGVTSNRLARCAVAKIKDPREQHEVLPDKPCCTIIWKGSLTSGQFPIASHSGALVPRRQFR
jgi:hypothetical protein